MFDLLCVKTHKRHFIHQFLLNYHEPYTYNRIGGGGCYLPGGMGTRGGQ